MRFSKVVLAAVAVATFSDCGLENLFGSAWHSPYARPASAVQGKADFPGLTPSNIVVIDGDGNVIPAFSTTVGNGQYKTQLPSAQYQWLRVGITSGNMTLRALVPQIGEETTQTVDLDARSMTETLIVEANISAKGTRFKQLTPAAYLGTRTLIQAAFDRPGLTQDLLNMVQRIMTQFDSTLSLSSPYFFNIPQLNPDFSVKTSPLDSAWLVRNPFDYVGAGVPQRDSTAFDTLLSQVAQLYKPEGCPDPNNIRVVFTVDFNSNTKDGNCGSINRFKWATDKPGKTMYFVGWVHKDSPLQDAQVNTLLGASTPNELQMYDDGTNGDEVAGDNIYTITFNLPRGSPGQRLRIGYKYTWGFRGAIWTGSEEWPGNSRILEVVDENGDNFVYRRDVFGDEATNKDNSNLNFSAGGSISWTTDLHGCGVPESHENKWYFNNVPSCSCGPIPTPQGVGPLTVSCTGS